MHIFVNLDDATPANNDYPLIHAYHIKKTLNPQNHPKKWEKRKGERKPSPRERRLQAEIYGHEHLMTWCVAIGQLKKDDVWAKQTGI